MTPPVGQRPPGTKWNGGNAAKRSGNELERRGRRFARYADDFLVMVRSAKAAERVMASLTRFIEGQMRLVVNRVKSKAAPLRQCTFPGFQIGSRGRAVWTAKAHARFKQRVREITRRNRGHRVQDVIDELRRYVSGWLNYFGISHTYNQVVELAEWVRRRVRLYYWTARRAEAAHRAAGSAATGNQWKRPRTRRRHLLALGTPPDEVKLATRSRKGLPFPLVTADPVGRPLASPVWRMSHNSVVQRALTNRWLHEQGVPDMRTSWIALHYGPDARV